MLGKCRTRSESIRHGYVDGERNPFHICAIATPSVMLYTLAFILILCRLSEQCSAGKDNPKQSRQPQHGHATAQEVRRGSTLCLSCEDFLTELKLAVPERIDKAVNGTRRAARDYLPFYSYVDSVIVDFLAGCVQSGSKRLFQCIDPRRECTRFMLC